MAGHVDRGAEAPAVEEVGQLVALDPLSNGSVTAKPRVSSWLPSWSQASPSTRCCTDAWAMSLMVMGAGTSQAAIT